MATFLSFPCVNAESLTVEDIKIFDNDSIAYQFDYESYRSSYLTSIDNDSFFNEIIIPKAIHEILSKN